MQRPEPASTELMKDREVQEALLRDAGGARTPSDVDELLLDLQEAEGYVSENPNVHRLAHLCMKAAAALVQLREENARLDADHNRIGAKCDALQATVDACGELYERAELSDLDANRYRWLRDGNNDLEGLASCRSGEDLDAEIDIAMRSGDGGRSHDAI